MATPGPGGRRSFVRRDGRAVSTAPGSLARWVLASSLAGIVSLANGGARVNAEAAPAAPPATAAVTGAGGTSGTDLRAGPADQWVTIAPGAERLWTSVDESADVFLVRFDLDHFRAEVVVGKGSPPQRRTAADVRAGRSAVAAVNGGFFDPGVVPLGLRIAGGDQRYPLRPKADWGVLVLGGHRARIVHTREYPPALTAAAEAPSPVARAAAPAPVTPSSVPIDGAIQVGPRLIAGGQALKLRPQLARRTAVALDRDGRFLTLVVSSDPVEANALAQRLVALGFDSALFLDGGPSTQLSLAVGDARAEIPGAYPVPDLLVILGRSSGRRNTPAPVGPTRRSGSPSAPSPTDARRP